MSKTVLAVVAFLSCLPLAMGATGMLDGALARLVFDDRGCLASLFEKETGRELAGDPAPFVHVRTKAGERLDPQSLRFEEDGERRLLTFGFPGGGTCRLEVTPFARRTGWNVRTLSCDVADAEDLFFARLGPARPVRKGSMSNVVFDDASAVVVRGYSPEIDMGPGRTLTFIGAGDGTSWVSVSRRFGFVGWRAGLAVASQTKIRDVLADMLDESGIVPTGCGGPKSLTAPGNRRGYLMGTWMDYESVDDWIRLTEKAGLQMLHLHAWWKTRGSYEPDVCFPGGLPQMKAAVDRIHAAGLDVTMHTLSAAIQFGDPLIDPKWFDQYMTLADYTLARPYKAGDTVLYVNERPWEKHDKILTGSTNGNILRLGDDLLQYADFSREKPYRFEGITVAREPWGEKAVFDDTQVVRTTREAGAEKSAKAARRLTRAAYPAGTPVSYLLQRYAEFYPKPKSELSRLCIGKIAKPYRELGVQGLYLDGAEGWVDRYAVDWMRTETLSELAGDGREVFNSTSCLTPFNWWQRGTIGAFDTPCYSPKGFIDRHILICFDYFKADLLRPELGWWAVQGPSARARGYFRDEAEYLGGKAAGYDASVSFEGVRVTDRPLDFSSDEQITVLGFWSRANYARALRPELLPRLRVLGSDFRLRQDESGAWRVTPHSTDRHRVASADFAHWSVRSPAARPAELRVEALYAPDRSAPGVRVLDASMFKDLQTSSATGVIVHASASQTLCLSATNVSAEPNAAWACLGRKLPEGVFDKAGDVSSVWVKGDGSGALLNVQVARASCFYGGYSENFVRLDFTGWRKIDLLLRERDADVSDRYRWPYESVKGMTTPANTYRTVISGKTVGAYNLYLNDIPKGKTVSVEVATWDVLPQMRPTMAAGAEVSVNGESFRVPFALAGGEWAELAEGMWTHYAENGEPLERVATKTRPAVKAGLNDLAFATSQLLNPSTPQPSFPRVEVTVFGLGEPEPAFVPLTDEQRAKMGVEYEFPQLLNPGKGLKGPFPVRVRPGERATVGFEILGPVKNPTVAGRRIPVTLKDVQERITCLDGRHWTAVRVIPGTCGDENRLTNARRETLAEGDIAPLPVLEGGTARFDVTTEDAGGARVTFFKRYE